ncbi:MAG: chemotaxis protein CheW [Pyrinomonadaceae bacterium]
MNETPDFTDISILPRTHNHADATKDARVRRELLIFKRAEMLFGVFADETAGATQGIKLTPLPRAPVAVLGVTSVRGRILTVLDPVALIAENSGARNADVSPAPVSVVALRGDEQLALVVDRVEGVVEIVVEEITPSDHSTRAVRGVVAHEALPVLVLDVQELFAATMHGAERRRRRSNI